jgi:hypothetical protein
MGTQMNNFLCLIDSGWVQAFGSIAAIAAGWFYLAKQHKNELQKSKLEADVEKSEKINLLIAIFSSLFDALQSTASKVRKGELIIELESGRLNSYQNRLMSLPVFDVPSYELMRHLEEIISTLHLTQTGLAGISKLQLPASPENEKFRQAIELAFHTASDSVVRGFLCATSAEFGLASKPLPASLDLLDIAQRSKGRSCVKDFVDYLSTTKNSP